jgi:hypothetical protein
MKKLFMIFLLVYSVSIAQIEIQYEVENRDQEISYNYLYISNENFAMKSENDDKKIIFDGSKQLLKVINSDKQNYIEINKKDISELAEKINQMNSIMQEQMSQMPESQKEKVKEMMQAQMPDKATKNINYEYKKTSESDVINGYSANKYEVYLNGEKEKQELWVTDYKNIDLNPKDFGAFLEFKEFMTEIFESIGNLGDVDYEMLWDFNNIDGFPVKTVFFDDYGKIKEIQILKYVKRNINDDNIFEVPENFKKKNMNF